MIPKKINLGCGNVILVKEVQRSVIQSAIGRDTEAAWLVETPEDASYIGVVLIDVSLPLKRKRFVLYHELVHAANDIALWERDAI